MSDSEQQQHMMDPTTITRNQHHAEQLRQAYGFEVAALEDHIVYPVGVEDFDYNGWTTFHHAASANDIEILTDILTQEGFSHLETPTERLDGHAFSPLLCAVKGNAVETFNILISKGADVNARDLNGAGVAEVAVMFGSVDLFEHLLVQRYEQKDLDVWQALLSMIYHRPESSEQDMRKHAIQMTEILMSKEKRYIRAFVDRGGLGAVRDLLLETINRAKPERLSSSQSKIKAAQQEEQEQAQRTLYIGALQVLKAILSQATVDQGKLLSSHYGDTVTILMRIMNRGKTGKEPDFEKESQIAGECLELIAGSVGWGVDCLANSCTISNLLRSILLDSDSLTQFQIIQTAYKKDGQALLNNISTTEIEVVLTILETEKRPSIKNFFVKFLKDFFGNGKAKQLLYSENVINALLSGLGGYDSEFDDISLQLLLLISGEEEGLQAIFKSTNGFILLVNRILLETEHRFDMCGKLLWKLVQSFVNLQDSVKLIENIGVTTVIRMLDSLDLEIQCIACEAIKILLNSDKHDYRAQLLRRELHLKLVQLLNDRSEGHVLYSVLTTLAHLSISWSSLHPIPAVQNAVLQYGCLGKLIQIANTSRFSSPSLQSAAYLLIAATLFGNAITEKRLIEYDLDKEDELLKQTKHSEQSLHNAITATALFRYHGLLMDNALYKFRSRFAEDSATSLFNVVVGRLCAGQQVGEEVRRILESPAEDSLIYISTLCKLKGCTDVIVREGMDTLLSFLYEGSPRAKQSAATALASLSYCKSGSEQLLILSLEDPHLVPLVTQLSTLVPLSGQLSQAMEGNSVREHRRRVLRKSAAYVLKLPDIGRNAITASHPVTPSNTASHPVTPSNKSRADQGDKTPVPGDELLSKIEPVAYTDISRLGLTRPYSRVATLPRLLADVGLKSRNSRLYSTVDRVYRKLYLRPVTTDARSARAGQVKSVTTDSLQSRGSDKYRVRQGLARSLSFVI